MDRRGFIGAGMAAAAGTLAVAGPGAAGPGPAASAIASYATGLREHGGPGDLAPGSRLVLERVHDRAFDRLSIAVLAADGRRLGYLPPIHSAVLAPLMDGGMGFAAEATEVRAGRRPALRLAIRPA